MMRDGWDDLLFGLVCVAGFVVLNLGLEVTDSMRPVFGTMISLTEEETDWIDELVGDLDELHTRSEVAKAALRVGLQRARKLDAGMLALEEELG